MPAPGPYRINSDYINSPWQLLDVNGLAVVVNTGANAVRFGATSGSIGFYGTSPIAKQTGVAVTAQGIHDACVALGLFAA